MIYPTAKISDRTKLELADNTVIGDFVLITVPYLKMGENSHINAGTKIIGRGKVIIGCNVAVTYDVLLVTSTDSVEAQMSDLLPDGERRIVTGNIVIQDDVYIGSKAIIMPNVTIGQGAVVGAGAYVSRDVKSNVVLIPRQTFITKKDVKVLNVKLHNP